MTRVKQGYGSFLQFWFNEENDPELMLWIYLSDWIILEKQIEIVNCEFEDTYKCVSALHKFIDKKLLEVKYFENHVFEFFSKTTLFYLSPLTYRFMIQTIICLCFLIVI